METAKAVAIHQPNFFPWLGFFDKIARADVFVFMDNVQFPRTSRGTWLNRVKMVVGGRDAWITAPVDRSGPEKRPIHEMRVKDDLPWREKLVRTLDANYRRAPFADEVLPVVSEVLANPTDSLAEFNIFAIRVLLERMRMRTDHLVLGSSLDVEGSATDLLISMTRAVGGTVYLCGGGADGYQEDDRFSEAGLGLQYQSFDHPVYSQATTESFVPGLSILDVLMNSGFEGTRSLLLQNGRMDSPVDQRS